jgi:tetratricopeptide (TPR) repeat protein
MPGNRAIYDRALEQSREAARQGEWERAFKEAYRALQEFPNEVAARTSLAVALFNTGKLTQALRVFEELQSKDQANPFFLEYIARIQDNNGNAPAAIRAYLQLADSHQERRLGAKTIAALRNVLRLDPQADEVRDRLALLLAEGGARADAANERLQLARRYQGQGRFEQASDEAEAALELDPNSRDAKELLTVLTEQLAGAVAAAEQAQPNEDGGNAPRASVGGMTGGLRGQQLALDKIVAQAIEAQDGGDADAAIVLYERAVELGLTRADALYSLGLLYQERAEHDKAVAVLQQAVNDPEYTLSAHYGLGNSYRELGQLPQAAQEFEQTLRLVDLQSIGKNESDDLVAMYEAAASTYQQMGDIARAASLYSGLAGFLQTKRWGRERADEFRARAKELTERSMFAKLRTLGTGVLNAPPPDAAPALPDDEPEAMPETWGKIRSITDFLRARPDTGDEDATPEPQPVADPLAALEALPPPPEPIFAPVTPLDTSDLDEGVERWVSASAKYIEQGLLVAAMDACHEVVRLAPNYLPVHLRMGEILERDRRSEDALTKYQVLIDTFVVRDEAHKAIDVYYRLIELSPDTINARTRLAELLRQAGRDEAAAEQVAVVASTYFRMGQTNKALDEYRRALQWAPNNKELHGQHGLALLKLERREAALSEFRRALELAPDDPVALARLNLTLALLGDQPVAVWDSLGSLLATLRAQGQSGQEVQAEYRAALMVAEEPILYYILGIIQQTQEQHQSAVLSFEQAQALLREGDDPVLSPLLVHQAIADSHIAAGQPELALEQLRLGQQLAPRTTPRTAVRHPFAVPLSQGELVRRMAEAYAAADDMTGAIDALQQAKQHIPYDRAIYTKLADMYFRQGRLSEALTQLDELASYYESAQDLDKAIEMLEYAAKLAPNNSGLISRLARLCIRRGLLDEGLSGLLRAAELYRKSGQLKEAVANLQQVADVKWMLGQHDETFALYEKILQIVPDDVEARMQLINFHIQRMDLRSAVVEQKQIVRIALKQRDNNGAIAALHQVIAIAPDDSEAYFQLGDVLMRVREYDQALRLFKRLARLPNVDHARVHALQTAAARMLEQQHP